MVFTLFKSPSFPNYISSLLFFLPIPLLPFLLIPCSSSAIPQPPTGLSVSEVTASSVTLHWDSDTSSEEPVRSFSIIYQARGANVNSRPKEEPGITRPAYTVGSLKPHTNYTFYVVAVNSVGRSRPSRPIEVTTGELGQYINISLSVSR